MILSILYMVNFSDAIQRNKLIKKATVSEVEEVLQKWLRYASDRLNGRKSGRRTIATSSADSVELDECSKAKKRCCPTKEASRLSRLSESTESD